MSDYLSNFLEESPLQDARPQSNGFHSKEAKNVKATCRYLEIEGPGVHEFLQYSHFYKAKLGSGVLALFFTNDLVKLEGTQDLLKSIAEEASLHTLPLVRSVDATHAAVQGIENYVSMINIGSV